MELNFHVGDTIKVHQKIKEGDKERIQIFEGIVISINNRGEGKSFTVRKIATDGVGVERIWPLNSLHIDKVVVKKKGDVRRAKLYFLRKREGKARMDLKERTEKPVKQIVEKPTTKQTTE